MYIHEAILATGNTNVLWQDCGSWTHDLGHTNGVSDMKVATHTSRLGTERKKICDTKGFCCVKTHKCLVCVVHGYTN